MKRLPIRELLFVTAPLPIIALGIWGYQLRQQNNPTRPTIFCTVTPATPLQQWQGAKVGVTVIGVVPTSFSQSNMYKMEYSLIGQSKPIGKVADSSGGTKNYHQIEKNVAYTQNELTSLPKPLTAEVSFGPVNNKSAIIKQQFTLPTQDINPPDIATVQRTNFRVTKVDLFSSTSPSAPTTPTWRLIIDLEDVDSQVASSSTSHKSTCLGLSISQNNKTIHPPIRITSTSVPNYIPTQVDIEMAAPTNQTPSPQSTKITCTLSVAAGWPQIIEAQLPTYPTALGHSNELKFTTKLAPLPPTHK